MSDQSLLPSAFQEAHRIALLVCSFLLFALILELVRRRQFKERYALLWLGVSLFGLTIGFFPGIVVWLSHVFHVQFLTTFFALSFLFFLGLVLSFCVIISRLSEKNRVLAQELALLENRVGKLERQHDQPE